MSTDYRQAMSQKPESRQLRSLRLLARLDHSDRATRTEPEPLKELKV